MCYVLCAMCHALTEHIAVAEYRKNMTPATIKIFDADPLDANFVHRKRISHIAVGSAEEAARHCPQSGMNTYVIRIFNSVPDSMGLYPELQEGHTWIREYYFDDLDASKWPDAGKLAHAIAADDIVLFNSKMAAQILADFEDIIHTHNIDLLLIHCQAGASRSPAVAGALCSLYGIGKNADVVEHFRQTPYIPNRHVATTLIDAGKKGMGLVSVMSFP